MYNSPSINFNKNDFKKLFKCSPIIFAAGDFNAKHRAWGSRYSNAVGKELFDFCQDFNLLFCTPESFTHYPFCKNGKPKRPDIIDFAIHKNFNYSINTSVLKELDSDHLPVVYTIDFNFNFNTHKSTWDFSKTNWSKFYDCLWDYQIPPDSLNSISQIDKAISKFTNKIKKAVEISTPKKTNFQNQNSLPDFISQMIDLRNSLINENRKHLNPNLNPIINKLRKLITKNIKVFKCDSWNNTVKNLNIKNHTIWKMTKALTRTYSTIPPLKDDTDALKYFSPLEKVNKIAEFFATTMTPHSEPSIPEFIAETDQMIEEYLKIPCKTEIPPTNLYRIREFFKKTKNNKAPGDDGISNFVMKKLPEHAFNSLANIYNSCFKLKYFPTSWKKANIIVIHKSGKDPNQASIYRPISLLNTMSKSLEAMFLAYFEKYLDENNLICKEQFGFRY